MKRRLKQFAAFMLAALLVTALFEPLSVCASDFCAGSESHIAYVKPGTQINQVVSSSSGLCVRYMKYGTDPANIDEDNDIFKHVYFVDSLRDSKPEFLDFYDSRLGYTEEGLTDWLVVYQFGWAGFSIYAIPIKSTDPLYANYISNPVYSNGSETFRISNPDFSTFKQSDVTSISDEDLNCEWFVSSSVSGTGMDEMNLISISPDTDEQIDTTKDMYFTKNGDTFTLSGISTYAAGSDAERIRKNQALVLSVADGTALSLKIECNLVSSGDFVVYPNIGVYYGGWSSIAGWRADTDGDIFALNSEYELNLNSYLRDNYYLRDGKLWLRFNISKTSGYGDISETDLSGSIKVSVKNYSYEKTASLGEATKFSDGGDACTIALSKINKKFSNELFAKITSDKLVSPIYTNSAKIYYPNNITSSASHGKVSVDKAALAGSKVTVNLTPDAGYKASGISVKTASGKSVNVSKESDTKYSFTMPAEDVKITASFAAADNDIKIKTVNGATLTASKDKAAAGTKITVKGKADDGYKVTGVTVTDANKKAVTVKKDSSGKYYFTMPSSAVTVKATVKADPYIKLGTSKLSMAKGQAFSLSKVTTTVAPYDKVASYKSSKASVVAVDSKGKLTAKATGSAAITITTKKGAKAKITVNVGSKAITTTKVKVTNVENGKLTLKKGKTFKTETAVTPITSQDKISFASNKATVASVDSKGKITAKKAGKATITVTSGKQKATFVVTVK